LTGSRNNFATLIDHEPQLNVGVLGQQRGSMAERMHNLEKSKRMIGMVAMNGLRPRVAWFYCITLLIGCCRDPETTMSWCGLFTTNNAEKSKQNSGMPAPAHSKEN
jgi:hypothetical protein